MKRIALIVLVFLSLFLNQEVARGSIAFSSTVSYRVYDHNDENDTSGENKSTSTGVDFRLGYILPLGILIGGTYATEAGSGAKSGVGTSLSGKRYGPTVGLTFATFNVLATYFISGEYSSGTGTGGYDYTNGSGYQLDLGWTWMLADSIGMGPNLVYRNMNYKRRVKISDGTEGTKNYRANEIYPTFAFWLMF